MRIAHFLWSRVRLRTLSEVRSGRWFVGFELYEWTGCFQGNVYMYSYITMRESMGKVRWRVMRRTLGGADSHMQGTAISIDLIFTPNPE